MDKLTFNCKCGKSLSVKILKGITVNVSCTCSVKHMVECTEAGTFIVKQMRGGNAVELPTFPKIFPFETGGITFGYDEYIVPKDGFSRIFHSGAKITHNHETLKGVISDNHLGAIDEIQLGMLNLALEQAVNVEDYETAAKIRDQIKERNG